MREALCFYTLYTTAPASARSHPTNTGASTVVIVKEARLIATRGLQINKSPLMQTVGAKLPHHSEETTPNVCGKCEDILSLLKVCVSLKFFPRFLGLAVLEGTAN